MTPLSLLTTLPLAADNPLNHVIDHAQLSAGGWTIISNHMIMIAIAAIIMLLVFPAVTKRYRDGEVVLSGRQANFLEAMMLFVRDEVAKPVIGKDTNKYIGFLWTLFFFILTCNLLGLLPLDALQSPFLYASHGHAVYGTATANIAVTAVLASVAFLYWNAAGIASHGIGPWAMHFTGGAPWYMWIIMVPVEILGMFVKPFALAIRLFANMTAGHVLVAVLISFTAAGWRLGGVGGAIGLGIPVLLGTVAIMLLELFVAFLQAYIFVFLTSVFIGQLVSHHDHEHEGDSDHAHTHTRDLDPDGLPDAATSAGAHMAG